MWCVPGTNFMAGEGLAEKRAEKRARERVHDEKSR
jgi:hypothetical protein